jgi:hypothetical protein
VRFSSPDEDASSDCHCMKGENHRTTPTGGARSHGSIADRSCSRGRVCRSLGESEKTSRRSSQALLAGQKDTSHQRPTGPASPRERAVSTAAGRSVRHPNARPPPAQPGTRRTDFTRLPKGHTTSATARTR